MTVNVVPSIESCAAKRLSIAPRDSTARGLPLQAKAEEKDDLIASH
jgi:hypothetical protein